MRKLKVWGGLTNTAKKPSPNGGMQARTIVCATSQKRAVEMLCAVPHNRCSMSLHYFQGYWCETGNEAELAIACRSGVWTAQVNTVGGDKADWKQLWPLATTR